MITQTATGFKVAIATNNRLIPDFIENPYNNIANGLAELNQKIDAVVYWLNPIHIWQGIGDLIASPATGVFLMSGTIIGIWLIAFGAKTPKKFIFWTWVGYWLLRGFVFV